MRCADHHVPKQPVLPVFQRHFAFFNAVLSFAVGFNHAESFRRHPDHVPPYAPVFQRLNDFLRPFSFLRQRQEADAVRALQQDVSRCSICFPNLNQQRKRSVCFFRRRFGCCRFSRFRLLRAQGNQRKLRSFLQIFLNPGSAGHGPVPGNKQRFHAVQAFDQPCAFFRAERKGGGRQGIPQHGTFGENGHRGQFVLHRPSRFTAQNMVVSHPVESKASFIYTAGHGGSAVIQRNQHGFSRSPVNILNPDFPRRSVRFHADGNDVPAEAQDGALNAFLFQLFLNRVGNVSLCDAAKVDHHPVFQRHVVAVNPDFPVVDLFRRRRQIFRRRNLRFPAGKVPKRGGRRNGHVKGAPAHLAHPDRCLKNLNRLCRNRDGFPFRMVNSPNVAAFDCPAQFILQFSAAFQRRVQQLRMIGIGGQCDHRIQIISDSGFFCQIICCCSAAPRRQNHHCCNDIGKNPYCFLHSPFLSGLSGLICSARNTRSATTPVSVPTAAPTPISTGR